jgi:hypothetical protein
MRHVTARGVLRALAAVAFALAVFAVFASVPFSASALAQPRSPTTAFGAQTGSQVTSDSAGTLNAEASGPVLPIPTTLWQPAAGSVPATGNYVYLKSDPGDYIGAGRTYLYTRASAAISVTASGGHLSVGVSGDEWWYGHFQTMSTLTTLQPGYYPGLQRYPFHDPAYGGLDWYGEGRGSNTLTGWFAIDSAAYFNGALASIDLRFELHSEGGTAALHGAIHWEANDTTPPPGPVLPIPTTLWHPAAGSVPASGSYVYLDSDPGDYIGAGHKYLYTIDNAVMSVSASGGHLAVGIDGEQSWGGDFQAMSTLTTLQSGYYPDLQRYPFQNPVKGGLDWSGEGRGSNTLTGWFAIDSVAYVEGALSAIDLRFEQHSEGGWAALHGVIHWVAGETRDLPVVTTASVGSIAGICATCGGNVVAAGSSDVTGRGVCWSTALNPTVADAKTSDGSGTGSFANSLTGLTPNTAYHVRAYATNASGTAYGVDRSFTTLDGPNGPVLPIPATIWRPVAGSVPSSGSYVYLDSDPGDYIGAGHKYLYTGADAQLTVSANGGYLFVGVDGDESWDGYFQAMAGITQLQPGYYSGLQRYGFHNPAYGGFDWYGQGRGSNTLTGWVAIDSVTYVNGALSAFDLRFEQHSEGGTPALHGAIHWEANDTTSPPGPVLPIPTTLWQPAAGSTPASGSYVYLDSDAGDYIGAGQDYLYTRANAQLSVSANGRHLSVNVDGDERWDGDFETMIGLTQLQSGYYPGLRRYSQNPVTGGLNWSGEGRYSNTLTGWVAIDSVTYVNGALSAIDLRFEQHSEGNAPALHGAIHWEANDPAPLPPGPVLPIPTTLWRPAAGSLPATGTYVYLDSDPGDYVGAGQDYLYTLASARLGVSASGGHLSVHVDGATWWYGHFQAMSSLTALQPGYYPDLHRYPFHNPVKGGLDWYGDGRGSNTLTGWFAIDSVTYVNGALSAIDLRFEQHSEGSTAALHGAIHWDANDPTPPPTPTPTPTPTRTSTPTPTPTPTPSSHVATTLTLTAPLVCTYGSATMSGTLKGADTHPLVNKSVTIRYYSAGSWITLGSATTNYGGAYTFAPAPTSTTTYQAAYAGGGTYTGSTSPTATLLPMVSLSTPAGPKWTRTTTTFTCSCTLKPRHIAGTFPVFFECQRLVSGRWLTKKTVQAGASDYSDCTSCSARIRLSTKGSWRIRAVHIVDPLNAGATSGWLPVKVR